MDKSEECNLPEWNRGQLLVTILWSLVMGFRHKSINLQNILRSQNYFIAHINHFEILNLGQIPF